jgi:hypothetical protein
MQSHNEVNDLLYRAVLKGDADAVMNLFSMNDALIDINKTDSHQMTLLHFAAGLGYVDIVDFLLAKGANPGVMNKDGRTPAHYARYKRRPDIANRINETLFWAAYNEKRGVGFFEISNLPADANITDILNHAAKNNNRTRQVCIQLGWMDEYGRLDQEQMKQFEIVTRCHATFWKVHAVCRRIDEVSFTRLPEDATFEEILYHAKNNNNRSRDVCVWLKLMDKHGNLTDKASFIKYESEEQCLNAFLHLHRKKMNRQWFKSTGLKENPGLADVLEHAAKKGNRSHLVCMTLGWMDGDGELTDNAPIAVKMARNENTNQNEKRANSLIVTI